MNLTPGTARRPSTRPPSSADPVEPGGSGSGVGGEARRAPQRPAAGVELEVPAEAGPARARALCAPPPRCAPGSPLPDPAAPVGFDPGLYPLNWRTAGGKELPRPAVNRSPASVYGGPAPINRSPAFSKSRSGPAPCGR